MSTRSKSKKTATKETAASIVWFDIPADDCARANKFYSKLFGWKIGPMPGMQDYWHVNTGGADASADGGVMPRKHPGHTTTQYISVPSVTRFMAKVEKLGGKVCVPKTAVPGMGYFAICEDTEKNGFALWERNDKAK